MLTHNATAQWLADHVGADWLHMVSKPNDTVGINFLITLRFDKEYCQSLVAVKNVDLYNGLVKRISQIRDEFFLLNMHAIPLEVGAELEARSRKQHGM